MACSRESTESFSKCSKRAWTCFVQSWGGIRVIHKSASRHILQTSFLTFMAKTMKITFKKLQQVVCVKPLWCDLYLLLDSPLPPCWATVEQFWDAPTKCRRCVQKWPLLPLQTWVNKRSKERTLKTREIRSLFGGGVLNHHLGPCIMYIYIDIDIDIDIDIYIY